MKNTDVVNRTSVVKTTLVRKDLPLSQKNYNFLLFPTEPLRDTRYFPAMDPRQCKGLINLKLYSMVEEQQIITLAYDVREGGPGGPLIERMDVHYPFKFLFGTGKLLPAFEEQLAGLSERASFEFTLTPQQAYGFVETGNIVDVPRAVFDSGHLGEEQLLEGQFIALTDDQGMTHNGKILEIRADAIKVDFNHALAGKTLHFKGVILNIRPATVDELVRGAYIAGDGVRGV